MNVNESINFYEFIGLPGSGKSSLCNKISDIYKIKSHKSLKIFFSFRLRFLISLIISPLIIIKFFRIFKVLYLLKNLSYGLMGSTRILLSILLTLGDLLLKKNLSKLESSLKGKKSLLDEGFLQCGLSVWLRTPPEISGYIWQAFLSYTPKESLFILIDLDYEIAFQRALEREKGIPVVISSRPWADNSEAYLRKQFFEISSLLKDEKIKKNKNFFSISSSGDLDAAVTELLSHLSKYIPPEELIIN